MKRNHPQGIYKESVVILPGDTYFDDAGAGSRRFRDGDTGCDGGSGHRYACAEADRSSGCALQCGQRDAKKFKQ